MATYPSRTPGPLGPLEDRISALEQQLRRVLSPTKEQYAQAVAGLNQADSVEATAGGGMSGASSGSWKEFLNLWAIVAKGKNEITGVVIAQAAMVDMTSGGGATLSLRIVARYPDGREAPSIAFQASKNAGASAVNNVVIGTARFAVQGVQEGDHVELSIQCAATNPGAFPENSGNYVQATGIYVSSTA